MFVSHTNGTWQQLSPNRYSLLPWPFQPATGAFGHDACTIAWSNLWGSPHPLLYQQGTATGGSANGKPDSNAYILEADCTPFGKDEPWLRPVANLKLVGLQYTIYTEFSRASRNYDGFGRNASDNNTLYLFAWFSI